MLLLLVPRAGSYSPDRANQRSRCRREGRENVAVIARKSGPARSSWVPETSLCGSNFLKIPRMDPPPGGSAVACCPASELEHSRRVGPLTHPRLLRDSPGRLYDSIESRIPPPEDVVLTRPRFRRTVTLGLFSRSLVPASIRFHAGFFHILTKRGGKKGDAVGMYAALVRGG